MPSLDRIGWVDMLAGALLLSDATDGETTAMEVPDGHLALVRERTDGGLVMVTGRSVVLWAGPAGFETLVTPLSGSERFNEGGCDPQGRLYAGFTVGDQLPGRGALLRIDPDGSTERVLDGLTVPNGIGWSPDGAVVYYVDSPTGRVDAFDFDERTGRLASRRPFAASPVAGAVPDGLCVDDEGGVWVALWDGGSVVRYDASGKVTEWVRLPCARVTSCSFSGRGLETLAITTSRLDLDVAEAEAGALFVHDAGVRGRPLPGFGG